ncbi:amidohydrolase family protein [Myceligenerans indicum]|uniref:Amidohydrolase family protein n=1 Tax=Myceligenerans indicum TaxID=2593663 RepID=A0ABS1LG20_9MICO|nr:amidohydrolase family protein [Myceligenerans indicum]MBL0885175.1 amidohydrolase family protein [Myceligenerans indicum]
MTGRVIDSHLHLWDLPRSDYAWITPELGPLHRSFGPGDAEVELTAAGVDAAVLVQADDTTSDTEFMLEVARAHHWVAGVVGWVPLDSEPGAAAALVALEGEPLLRGVRHLVHDDPRDDFLDLPDVRASLGRVAAQGLTFDVPDAWPRHLDAAARLARDLPELTVVLDHLGKPPAGGHGLGEWRAQLDRLAAAPNAVVKFSGLHLPGVPFTEAGVGLLLDVALEAFGADRVMYGGDWPMSVPHGGYRHTWDVMRACLDRLAPGERDAVLGGNAEHIYGLNEISRKRNQC